MSKFLTPALAAGVAGILIVVALAIVLWPPGLLAGGLLAALGLGLAAAIAAHLATRRRHRDAWQGAADPSSELSPEELAEWRMRVLAEKERQLELRELKLGRQMRALQIANEDYLDILDVDPPAGELEELADVDRKLIGLIEAESQRAFERILNNRYGTEHGVNVGLILADVREFVESVALLYRPGTEDPLLETEIERVAKGLSSAALHLLVVVDDLPINLQSYNTARMYRLIRRGVSYYGTYKAFRPYVEHGLNVLQLARLALGMNPVVVGGAWIAGKLATHGARAIGERVLQRRALQLVTDFIRVIGYEAAMLYGGDFRHRDANWVLGAELVNFEISRLPDLGGRDAALATLCNLALRHEFDRLRLLNHLARHRWIDVGRVKPQLIMTRAERVDAATVLARHGRETGADFSLPGVVRWREAAESRLGARLDVDRPSKASGSSRGDAAGGRGRGLRFLRRGKK